MTSVDPATQPVRAAHSALTGPACQGRHRYLPAAAALALLAVVGGCGGGGSANSSSYTVGGTVSGLTGTGLELQNNGGNTLAIAASGAFSFTIGLSVGSSYAVTIAQQPSDQTCAISNGNGTLAEANVTGVLVNCQTIAAAASNVAPIIVDSGPSSLPAADADMNTPFVTVTVCAPGSTTNCQTIDHVEVDTGSYGLRLMASVLSNTLYSALPQVFETSSSEALAECIVFADGFSWGSVKTADIRVATESASSLEVQLIGDPAYTNVPADCTGTGALEDTVDSFGANGIIGIGPFVQDCGEGCVSGPQSAFYYVCASSVSCADHTVSLAQQLNNPVALFATDNNGTIVELPGIPATGAASASGSLVFGIGTESNNGLGGAQVLTVNDTTGYLTTQFNGNALSDSFFDSGSNGLFFNDSSITECQSDSSFFCPSSALSFLATNIGLNGTSSSVGFSIADADDLSSTAYAFNDLGGPNVLPDSFDWGLPFFFGRNVYTAIEGQNTKAGPGPYFAY